MNNYTLIKLDGKIVDISQIASITIRGTDNLKKVMEMLETRSIEDVGEHFCHKCGCYKETEECDCKFY